MNKSNVEKLLHKQTYINKVQVFRPIKSFGFKESFRNQKQVEH